MAYSQCCCRLAIRNHLPLAECAHFGQHRTAQALYDAVVTRYSSPATAALGRLLLPFLFPELSDFAKVEDLVSHLRTSDARYRAPVPAEFLDRNQPPMFITLYFIVTRLPESLCSARDHFLSLDPTSLTIDLLEQHLLAAELTSLMLRTSGLLLLVRSAAAARARVAGVVEVAAGVVVGAAVEVVEAVEMMAAVGLVEGVGALVAMVEAAVGVAAMAVVGLAAVGLELGVEVLEVASGSSRSVGARPSRPRSFVTVLIKHAGDTEHRCFFHLDDAWHAEFGDEVERTRWADLLRSGVSIFDLDFDAMLSAMYALSVSTEGDCYQCVPPDPGIAAAALGANESGTLPSTAPAEAWHTFTLDSGALRYFFHDSTTLTPLSALVPVRLADPSGGPVVARSSTVLLCPAVPSGSLSGLHLPSFSMNLGRQRSILLVVDDYTRYTAVFPLSSKGEVPDVLIPWIHTVHLQLRERFGLDLSVLHLHFDRGADGFAECRIGLVMEVARTSMIHAAAPHFLWPFAVRYASHQLNLWLRVSLPETSPTLRWTGEVGDASVFRVWGSRALVRDTFSTPSQDVTFDDSVPFYHLFPYRSAPPLPTPLFLAPGPPAVDPLPPHGPAPSGAARGAASGGVEPGGLGPGGAKSEGAGSRGAERGGAERGGAEPGGAEPAGVEPGGAEPGGAASSGGPAVTLPKPLSPQQLREWLVQRARLPSGVAGARDTGAGGTRVTAGAGGTRCTAAAGPGGARTRGAGATGTGSVGDAGAGAGDPAEPGGAKAGAVGTGAGGGGTGAGGAGAGAGDLGAGGDVSGVTARRASRPRPPPVPGTHAMALRPSSVPLCVPLPPHSASSLPTMPDPESDLVRAASPIVSRPHATVVTDPSFESAAASTLVADLVDFAPACCLDYASALVAESESASPPSVGGECALGTDILEDRHEDFECLAAAVPHFASTLLAP
ncbi:unnamed protein product [Closterium sp. NIES-53]